MNGNVNIVLKINKKIGLILLSVVGVLAMADYVTIVDSKSNGGISITNETIIDTTPIGSIILWGTPNIPSGWIELNGGSTAGYSELASLYGSNVPDMRGQVARGWDNGKGIDSGRSLLSYQADDIKAHNHDIISGNGYGVVMARQTVNGTGDNAVFSHYRYGYGNTYSNPKDNDTIKALPQYQGVAMNSENRVKNIALMYIIKAESN